MTEKEKIKRIKKNIDIAKKESKKIFEIKKIVNSLLLDKKGKIEEIKKLMNIPEKDAYKPIKISGAFSDNFVEYKGDSKKDNQYQLQDILIISKNI